MDAPTLPSHTATPDCCVSLQRVLRDIEHLALMHDLDLVAADARRARLHIGEREAVVTLEGLQRCASDPSLQAPHWGRLRMLLRSAGELLEQASHRRKA